MAQSQPTMGDKGAGILMSRLRSHFIIKTSIMDTI
jgi:hypothetical protein